MTESTTIAEPRQESTALCVEIEDDAAPLVRLIGQTLRTAARGGQEYDAIGTVAVRSHDTPQAATIAYDGDVVVVTGGVLTAVDATLVVDLHARLALVDEPEGDAALAARAAAALRPSLPGWREAAERFWAVTRQIPGVPDVLLVEAAGADGVELGRFGDGPTEYLLAGPADLLAGVFTGADDLLAALAAGLQVRGTLSQLSVMTAASWKVRFDV